MLMLFCLFILNPDNWYIPGIYHVYSSYMQYWNILGIYHVYPTDWKYMVYTMDVTGISIMYIRGLYMVYHLKYIPVVYLVYALYIPSFLKPDFSACQCSTAAAAGPELVSVNAHTCVGDPEYFIPSPRATMAIVPQGRGPTNGSTRLQPTSPLCCWRPQWRLRQRLCSGRLSVFLVLLRTTNWFLARGGCEDQRGCLQGMWHIHVSNMDLIQVGVSVTGSWKKRILCVSPMAGPAQPAALSGHYILYTTCV